MKHLRNRPFDLFLRGIASHKAAAAVIAIAVIGGGYEIGASIKTASASPQYQIERVGLGSIIQTVAGTGEVSAENQLDVTSQVSGAVTSIDVKVGQHVNKGDLIATIDDTDALNSLESAKIAYAKLVEPPTNTDLTNARDTVSQAYGTAYNAIASTFISLQTIMPSMNDLFYKSGTFLSDQQSTNLPATGQSYRLAAGSDYDAANVLYQSALAEYKSLSRTSSTSTITSVLSDTYALSQKVSASLQKTQNTITWIENAQPSYQPSLASTAQTDVATWLSTMNSAVASLLSAQTGITSSQNALSDLVTGATSLDIQSQQLALTQAQQAYDKYFIRAPFSGVIGRIPVSLYDQAGSGTTIATVVGDQKIAALSLDEVDAAKVKAGDPVSITFNAINDLTATGTVQEIDQVGTVSSGVVAYGVKVDIGTADSRILPGMSVNATITTDESDGVLVVPSAAIKTQGSRSYVQTFSAADVSSLLSALRPQGSGPSSGTSSAATRFRSASSTAGYASSSPYARTGGTAVQGSARTVTISTSLLPATQIVTVGTSDDTNTEIVSGLTAGDWVVIKTVAASGSSSASAAAPSLLSSFGGARGAGGAARAFRAGGN
ncbi:MAG: HlyD family efflux transporter periplasmic adaptor subunit [Patescibacteria group bacterium]|nr:HlyD family efflux transporter periplasmic adaptor subunit [Patescibacteria group bacterium]